MGVQGLWQLLEPAGRPVTLESLEGKRLAVGSCGVVICVDVSLWMHQSVRGAASHRPDVRNPHLVTLFQRLAKLLFYRVRPIFVFDGVNVPALKQRTLNSRRLKRDVAGLKLSKVQRKLLAKMAQKSLEGEQTAHQITGTGTSGTADELFHLPQIPQSKDDDDAESDSGESVENVIDTSISSTETDVNSAKFHNLPFELQREVLLDAQEKQRESRVKAEMLPDDAQQFSSFQLQRLLKKNKINQRIEQVNKQLTVVQSAAAIEAAHIDAQTSDVKRIVNEGMKRQHILIRDPVVRLPVEQKTALDVTESTLCTKKTLNYGPETTRPVVSDLCEKPETSLISAADTEPRYSPVAKTETVEQDCVPRSQTPPYAVSPHFPTFDISPSPTSTKIENVRTVHSQPRAASPEMDIVTQRPCTSGINSHMETDYEQSARQSPILSSDEEFEDVNDIVPEFASDTMEFRTDDDGLPLPARNSTSADHKSSIPENVNIETEINLERKRQTYASEQRTVTDQVYAECQELLSLFGVPYIVAAGEAEAQCAWLELNGFVSGTVTEDSDAWLFGAKKIYRHIFNKDKLPQLYTAQDCFNRLGLTRSHFIQLAMLSGCDYTDGIEGVGIVTALEILSEFGPEDSITPLKAFKEWWVSMHNEAKPPQNPIRARLAKLNCIFPESYPDPMVFDAFMKPTVDESHEPFSWGVLNKNALVQMAFDKMSWNEQKTMEILQPIIAKQKEAAKGSIQTHMSSFTYTLTKDPTDLKLCTSKRVQGALRKFKSEPAIKTQASPEKVTKASAKAPKSRKRPSPSKPSQSRQPISKRPQRKSKQVAKDKLGELCLSEESD